MATPINDTYLNQLFVYHLDSNDGKVKLAEAGKEYIKTKLRERSFARHILNPVKVTKADCTRAVDHEGLVKIVDIEPDSKAMAINFRSEPNGRYITGSRYQIPFFTIASERFSKAEQELMTWEAPITKIIEENIVKDIEYVEDSFFLAYVNSAISQGDAAVTGQAVNPVGNGGKLATVKTTSGMIEDFTPFTTGIKMVEQADPSGKTKGNTRPCQLILMNQQTYTDLFNLDGNKLGLELKTEVTKDGYTYDKLMGKRLVVTMKSDLVKYGELYFFAPQEYMGHWFILNDTRFYLNKEFNLIQMQAMEEIGMGIANINAMAKVMVKKA